MGYITQTKDYWIAPNAVTITLNALGEANRIQGSVASGAVISCYIENVKPGGDNGDGLQLDNGRNPRRWPLSLSPTYFNTDTQKYVYAAIPRSATIGSQAVIVFPSEQIDIYGKNGTDEQIGSADYFYVYLNGIISAVYTDESNTQRRRWTKDPSGNWGTLGTYEDLVKVNDADWYRWDAATQLTTFLKNLTMQDGTTFLKLFAEDVQAKIIHGVQQLVFGSGEGAQPLTGVAVNPTDDEATDKVVTPVYLDEFGNTRYISKVHDDVAEGKITFQDVSTFLKGLRVGSGEYGIDSKGTGKFYDSIFSNVLKSIGAIAGERGIYMDAQKGTVQAEGMDVLGWLRVETLEYNNVRLMGQDFIFSEGGDVEKVEIIDEDQKLYLLHIHKEKEGKHVEFADNDILYGQVDQLENNGLYYTSWCQVIPYDNEHSGVTLNDGMTPDTVRVQLFPNDAVPGGYNDVPVVHMTLAHRGNTKNAERQQLWELSTTNKRIQFLWHVDAPKLRDENYALVWGILPQLGFFPTTLDYSMPSLFAGGLIVDHQHIHHVNYPVPTDYIIRDKGDWVQPAADSEGYRHGVVDYADGRKEAVTDQVQHNGFTWRCVVDHTKQEPSVNGSDWVAVGGGSDGKDGENARDVKIFGAETILNGQGSVTLKAHVYDGGDDITDEFPVAAFSWKRTNLERSDTSGDNNWTIQHTGYGNTVVVDSTDFYRRCLFECFVTWGMRGLK